MMAIPTLRTERLVLRGFRLADLDALAAMYADPEVARFIGPRRPRDRVETWRSLETILGQWALRGYGLFAVESRRDGAFLGRVGILNPLDWPEPELAYALARTAWGKGFAAEAAQAVRAWGFDTFGFPRLASFILPDNARSRLLAERIGAVHEGMAVLSGHAVEHWVHPAPGHGALA
jgi:RimJ/RimL family protein N-acetyltransferase